MDREFELLFNKIMLRNKRDVIEALLRKIGEWEKSDLGNVSIIKIKCLIKLANDMLMRLDLADIPTLEEPFTCYHIQEKNDGLELQELYFEDIEIYSDECDCYLVLDYLLANKQPVLKVTCEYIKVQEYAALNGVTENTVRNWIRRGKLRNVIKEGRDWMIPVLCENPERGFSEVAYVWGNCPEDIKNEMPDIPDNGMLVITRGAYGEGSYIVTVTDLTNNTQEVKILSSAERERLEAKMIASPQVTIIDDEELELKCEKHLLGNPWMLKDAVDFSVEETLLISGKYIDLSLDAFSSDMYPGEYLEDEGYLDDIKQFEIEFYGAQYDETDDCNISPIYDENKREQISVLKGTLLLKDLREKFIWSILADKANKQMIARDMLYILNLDDSYENSIDEIFYDSSDDILVINEFQLKEEFKDDKLFDRILREIPYMVGKKLTITPHIIMVSLKNYKEEEKKWLQERYELNGFKRFHDTDVMFVYC